MTIIRGPWMPAGLDPEVAAVCMDVRTMMSLGRRPLGVVRKHGHYYPVDNLAGLRLTDTIAVLTQIGPLRLCQPLP